MDKFVVLCLTVGLCTSRAQSDVCPPEFAMNVHDAYGISNQQATVQQGIWHRLPCPPFRTGEKLIGGTWYKGTNIDDPSKERLISRLGTAEDSTDNRYAFSSGYSLVIQSVDKRDEGRYICLVIPSENVDRDGTIDLRVIGDMFPASLSDTTPATINLNREGRHTLPCPCVQRAPSDGFSTVYWSEGTRVTSDTDIIGVRFLDGTILQFQHGADYSIDSDSALIVNSISNVRDNKRFWCHVFQPDGSLNNCYTNVEIPDEYPSDHALQASATSFYILKGTKQILPCTKWTVSDRTCELQWYKGDVLHPSLLINYTAWSDITYADPAFDLGSDFSLVLKSVDDDDGGMYSCTADRGTQDDSIDVQVIGTTFPLDNGEISRSETMNFEPGQNYTLTCVAGLTNANARGTLIWSFGLTDADNTTVIGTLRLPDQSKMISDLGGNRCFDITITGSLLLSGCSQDGDVRYWCHVFPDSGMVYRSYVDMIIQNADDPSYVGVIIGIIITTIVCVMIVVLLVWRLHKRNGRHGQLRSYVMVDVEEPTPDLDVTKLLNEVKKFVMRTRGRLPITPWVTKDDDACYAPIQAMYTPLELFINVYTADNTVRYRLESESQIFDDGIPQFKSRHVLIEGRAGSGKTALLSKLVFDRYMEQPNALLGQTRLVFVLPVGVLIKSGNIGEAVVQHILPKDIKISAKSINSYCANHSMDVAILVDDCNDKEDIQRVMKVIKDQGLLNSLVVMTTRQMKQAGDICCEFDIRHVNIIGFTLDNAHKYVRSVLKSTDTRSSLEEYLNEHILQPEISCLPINLTALCQLSMWTKGKGFRPELSTCDLFIKMVKCMFDRANCTTYDSTCSPVDPITISSLGNELTENQRKLLLDLGRVALLRICQCNDDEVVYSEVDFLNYGENAHDVLDYGIRVGIIRVDQEVNGDSGSEKGRKVDFVLEIFQDLCAGISLTYSEESLSYWLTKLQTLDIRTKLTNILVFAGLYSYSAHPSLIHHLVSNITSAQKKTLRDELHVQKMVEVCLQLNMECKSDSSELISPMFDGGMVRIIGISSHKLQLLQTYLLQHAKKDSEKRLNLKSIKLFRIGEHHSAELREYLEYFLSGALKDTDSKTSQEKDSDYENETMKQLFERVESRLSGMSEFRSEQSDTSVLQTLQSPGLLEVMQSQYGQCYSSSSAQELGRCLPSFKMLKKIVLIGTILRSEDICNFAAKLNELPSLKKLDLRLNKQLDDKAFVAITNSLHACKNLTDLRLSLYRVTIAGFDYTRERLHENDTSWKRLKKLYLLHGNPPESFVKFLASILKYLHFVEIFHISGPNPVDEIPCDVLDEFQNEIGKMRNLDDLAIANMDPLKARMSSFKPVKAVKPVQTIKTAVTSIFPSKDKDKDVIPKESETQVLKDSDVSAPTTPPTEESNTIKKDKDKTSFSKESKALPSDTPLHSPVDERTTSPTEDPNLNVKLQVDSSEQQGPDQTAIESQI